MVEQQDSSIRYLSIAIIAILAIQTLIIVSFMFYFHKKENDALLTLFKTRERITQLEKEIHQRPSSNVGSQENP